MRVLITGMTASQSSQRLNERTLQFAGTIQKSLHRNSAVCHIAKPGTALEMVKDFDVVLVGLAPMLSLASNDTYGAMALIGKLAGTDRLRFFIDAPDPAKISASLRAIQKDRNVLTKDLYRNRPMYELTRSDKRTVKLIDKAIALLANGDWPVTLYPRLPWAIEDTAFGLPEGATQALTGLSVDHEYVGMKPAPGTSRENLWLVDDRFSKWTQRTIAQTIYPSERVKSNRTWSDRDILQNMARAVGVIISPQADGSSWWTPRFIQSLQAGTPVVTEWRHSQDLGSAWSILASALESTTLVDRLEISTIQRRQYIDKIDSPDESYEQLTNSLRDRTAA